MFGRARPDHHSAAKVPGRGVLDRFDFKRERSQCDVNVDPFAGFQQQHPMIERKCPGIGAPRSKPREQRVEYVLFISVRGEDRVIHIGCCAWLAPPSNHQPADQACRNLSRVERGQHVEGGSNQVWRRPIDHGFRRAKTR